MAFSLASLEAFCSTKVLPFTVMLLALSSAFFASETYPDTIPSASSSNWVSYNSAVCAAVSFEKSGLPSSNMGTIVPSSRVIAGVCSVCSDVSVVFSPPCTAPSTEYVPSPLIVTFSGTGGSSSFTSIPPLSPSISPLFSSIIEEGIACLYSSSVIVEIVATSSLFTA